MHYVTSPKHTKANKSSDQGVLDANYFLASPISSKLLIASLSLLSINQTQVFNLNDVSKYLQSDYAKEDLFVTSPATPSPYLKVETLSKRPNLVQLNVGSFGLDSDNNDIDQDYYETGKKLITFLQSQKSQTLVFNLQDVPNDQFLWEQINSDGYSVFWYPTNHYSQGKYKSRPDTGNAILINTNLQGYKLQLDNCFIKYHSTEIPDYGQYNKKSSSQDLIQISSTMYAVFRNEQSKEVFLIANTYISPFITQQKRLQIIDNIIATTKEFHLQANQSYSGYKVIHRFAGDFNVYGVDSNKGPFGLPANPFSFLPSVIDSLITGFRPFRILRFKSPFVPGKNHIHRNERSHLQGLASIYGFQSLPSSDTDQFSISIPIAKYAPSLLKPIFAGSECRWLLDYVIYPIYEVGVYTYFSLDPFGQRDHKSLIVSL
jgi:hypothetical protein